MSQSELSPIQDRLAELKGQLRRLQIQLRQLGTGLNDFEHKLNRPPSEVQKKTEALVPLPKSPVTPNLIMPSLNAVVPTIEETLPSNAYGESSDVQRRSWKNSPSLGVNSPLLGRNNLERLTRGRNLSKTNRPPKDLFLRLRIFGLGTPIQFVKGFWSEKKNTSWLVSILLHLSTLLVLACWTITTRGELNPLNLLLHAAHPEPLELAVVELVTTMETPTVETPTPDDSILTEADPTEVLTAVAESLDANLVQEISPADVALPELLTQPLATAASSADATSSPRQAAARNTGRPRPEPRTRRKKGPSVEFFGTRGTSLRVVYLVDNSNSMHSGRFETALGELHRSVMALSTDQSFYVIFYSDTAYGLFHPATAADLIPATRDNKQRFSNWLTTVEMCTGGQLLKAFEFAEKLGPDTVFLLSDGVIQSENAMAHLVQSEGRRFTVNSIGLTVPDPLSAHRLRAIAEAHRGTLQLVGIHPAARLAAQQNPIRRNRNHGAVWGIQLPAR